MTNTRAAHGGAKHVHPKSTAAASSKLRRSPIHSVTLLLLWMALLATLGPSKDSSSLFMASAFGVVPSLVSRTPLSNRGGVQSFSTKQRSPLQPQRCRSQWWSLYLAVEDMSEEDEVYSVLAQDQAEEAAAEAAAAKAAQTKTTAKPLCRLRR